MVTAAKIINPALEHSLLLVKPDGVKRGLVGQIITRIENRGFTLVGLKLVSADLELLRNHYDEHKDKPFFGELVSYMTSAPLVAMVVEGNQVIECVRTMLGATDPVKAAPGTIRGDFSRDWGPDEAVQNIVHASDCADSAAKEISLWFPELV